MPFLSWGRQCPPPAADAPVLTSPIPHFQKGGSNLDGNDAVIVSYDEEPGVGAVWAVSKHRGEWKQTDFQVEEPNYWFGWSNAVRGGTIMLGMPAHQGRTRYHPDNPDIWWPSGRGLVVVLEKNYATGSWSEKTVIYPSVADDDAHFGVSIDISEDGRYAAVG